MNGFFSGSEAGALASAILAWVSRCVTVSYRIREGGCLVLPLLLGAAVGGAMKASSACEWWGSQSSNDRRCTVTPAKGPASDYESQVFFYSPLQLPVKHGVQHRSVAAIVEPPRFRGLTWETAAIRERLVRLLSKPTDCTLRSAGRSRNSSRYFRMGRKLKLRSMCWLTLTLPSLQMSKLFCRLPNATLQMFKQVISYVIFSYMCPFPWIPPLVAEHR